MCSLAEDWRVDSRACNDRTCLRKQLEPFAPDYYTWVTAFFLFATQKKRATPCAAEPGSCSTPLDRRAAGVGGVRYRRHPRLIGEAINWQRRYGHLAVRHEFKDSFLERTAIDKKP